MSPIALSPARSDLTTPGAAALLESLAELQTAIDRYEVTPSLQNRRALKQARQCAAGHVAKLDKSQSQSPVVKSVLDVLARAIANGGLDEPLTADDIAQLDAWRRLGWPGLVASMLTTSAWRWSEAPTLGSVPDWLWSHYTEWAFAPATTFDDQADATRHVDHLTRQTDELARWVSRNLGSASVRSAADVYGRRSSLAALRPLALPLRPLAEKRGRILSRIFARTNDHFDPSLTPRPGRRLKIGVVARTWEGTPDNFVALARFEHLPADRFEVVLFSTQPPVPGFAEYCASRATDFRILSGTVADNVAAIRDSNLDVVVFNADLASNTDELGQVALHRVAPLQTALMCDAATTGLPLVDLAPVPAAWCDGAPPRYTERVGRLMGPAFGYALHRGSESGLEYARADLGFPADAFVFVAVLNHAIAPLDQLATWARFLARVPRARLVVHLLPAENATPYAAERLNDAIVEVCRREGVPTDAVSVLAPDCVSLAETRAIIRLADVVLGTFGSTVWAAEAISAGIPVLSSDPTTNLLLAGEGLAELTANDDESLIRLATSLVENPDGLAALRSRLGAMVESGFAFLDTKATSDAFAALLEAAFDEVQDEGIAEFRRRSKPVAAPTAAPLSEAVERARAALDDGDFQAASDVARLALQTDPRNPEARVIYGRVLLNEGRSEAAIEYLLAAIQQKVEDAGVWFTLAKAFREAGKPGEAVQALESSLRLDGSRADGWLMLIELAEATGAMDIAQQAFDALKSVAPDHPQVAELSYRFQS